MRMLQICCGLDLGEEPLGADDGGQLGAEDLERHAAVMAQVLREVDRSHPALTELALDAVAVLECLGEAGEEIHPRLQCSRGTNGASFLDSCRGRNSDPEPYQST